jgi:N6-adenosine-specific RNA methylase IME4
MTTPTIITPGEVNLYESACRAVAACKTVDEAKDLRDKAMAMQVYAKQAKDRRLIEDATKIRLRAERRAGELLREMEKNQGAVPGKTGRKAQPVLDTQPKLSDLGISKTQSSRWQALAALPQQQYESVEADACAKVSRAVRNATREIEIEQERAGHRARAVTGCTADDLHALAATGFKAATIYVDVPSKFHVYSGKGKQRNADRRYDTMTIDELKAMAPLIAALATKDCALLYWTSGPYNKNALEIIESWGLDYNTWAFAWVKTNPNSGTPELEELKPEDLHRGTGFTTWSNIEVVLLAKRGEPKRLAKDVNQVVIAPATDHSKKPEEVARRIERLYPGPYLELFARRERDGWTTWGNEILRADFAAPKAAVSTSLGVRPAAQTELFP